MKKQINIGKVTVIYFVILYSISKMIFLLLLFLLFNFSYRCYSYDFPYNFAFQILLQ